MSIDVFRWKNGLGTVIEPEAKQAGVLPDRTGGRAPGFGPHRALAEGMRRVAAGVRRAKTRGEMAGYEADTRGGRRTGEVARADEADGGVAT